MNTSKAVNQYMNLILELLKRFQVFVAVYRLSCHEEGEKACQNRSFQNRIYRNR